MDLWAWLRSLGLERYEAVFRDNEIDADVLHDLTDNHLREMGVALGARLKLLKAIAALSPRAEPASRTSAVALASLAVDAAERRQVTVMFSDLVGSTSLSVRMDPEDLREVISAYQKCVAETVHSFDGFVARYVGDGTLVYFLSASPRGRRRAGGTGWAGAHHRCNRAQVARLPADPGRNCDGGG